MEKQTLPVEYITIENYESCCGDHDNDMLLSISSDSNSDYDDDLSEISFITHQCDFDMTTLPSQVPAIEPAPILVPVEGTHKNSHRSDLSLLSFASRCDLSLLSFDESSFDGSNYKGQSVPTVVAISKEVCHSKQNHEWWSSFADEFSALPSTYMSYLVSSYASLTTSPYPSSTTSASKVSTPTLIDDDLSLSSSDNSIQLEHIEDKFRSIETQYSDQTPTMSLKRSTAQWSKLDYLTDIDDSSMKRRCSNLTLLQTLWS